jgi:hypothetical protein
MITRALVAVGLAVSATILGAPAFAQGNPNTPPPPPPGPPPPITVTLPQPPAADRPLIKAVPRPTAIIVDGGAGVLGYLSGTGRLGPAWNVRVTADFSRRFAAEANYVGSANRRSDDTGTLVYNSVDADLRYNILRADEAPVQPYLSAGLGWAGFFGPGGTPFALVTPVAAGVERMLTEHVKIGARFNIRPTFFDDLGHGYEKNPPGGDSWNLVVNLGGAF